MLCKLICAGTSRENLTLGLIFFLTLIGFAGSDEKVKYIKELGFDAAYNYKTIGPLSDTLKEACPNGIDMFFDNVSLHMTVSNELCDHV